METYFIAIRITPLADNPLEAKIEEATVYFWIVETTPEAATEKASRYLASYRWKLESVQTEAVAVTAADFADQEDGLKNWWKAKQKGFAAQFVAKPKPATTPADKIPAL